MNKSPRIPYEPQSVPHPGEMVVEYLASNGWPQRELARRTGLTPKTISEICGGKAPITPSTALALEKVLRRPAHFWLNLQRQFDEAEARLRAREKSVPWKSWAAKFPLKQMKRFGWFEQLGGHDDVDRLLAFFSVSSPETWSSVWDRHEVAYRQTRKIRISEEAAAVWVRAAELTIANLPIATFDEQRFRSALLEVRRATRRRCDEVIEPVQQLCAAAGVGVAWVPELPHTGISGCAKWLSGERALLALSLRYKFDDQIWFTFFHEAAHLLLHRRERPFVLDNADEDLSDRVVDPEMQQVEDEANRFAADMLIPPDELSAFIRKGSFDNDDIFDFADRVGIGPGIVVGRLQFEKILAPHQGNKLKQRFEWALRDDEDQ
jgi:HTH-type transcriptional regulator / antitoxin HigA